MLRLLYWAFQLSRPTIPNTLGEPAAHPAAAPAFFPSTVYSRSLGPAPRNGADQPEARLGGGSSGGLGASPSCMALDQPPHSSVPQFLYLQNGYYQELLRTLTGPLEEPGTEAGREQRLGQRFRNGRRMQE